MMERIIRQYEEKEPKYRIMAIIRFVLDLRYVA